MKYRFSGTKKIPKEKSATFGYKEFETKSVDELIKFVNTHAIIPCVVEKGHRNKDNVKEILPWIRLDVDMKGEAKKIDKALKNVWHIKKPSTSNDKFPYKWHYLIPIKNVSQNYDAYKLQYYHFLGDHKIDLRDKSLASVVQNTNPYGIKGVDKTTVVKGEIWSAPNVKPPKKKKLKENHSSVSKAEVKKALSQKSMSHHVKRDASGNRISDEGFGYEEFLKIGMALYSWCPKRGYKLYKKWAEDTGSYYADTVDDKWDDFNSGSLSGDVTVGTLFELAFPEEKRIDPMDGFKDEGVALVRNKPKKPMSKKEIKEVEKDMKKDKNTIEYRPKDFPPQIADYMQECATAMSLNFSSTVPYTMMMLSQMLGNKVKVKMNSSWTHTPIIWGLNVASAGIGKSPLMKKLSKPMAKIEHGNYEKYKKEMKEWKAEVARCQLDIKNGTMKEEDLPPAPVLKSLTIQKYTSELLYKKLEQTPDGVMLWADELTGLLNELDRSKEKRSDLVESWSGGTITYETKHQGINRVEEAYMRVGGNVQPKPIEDILQGNSSGLRADGFIARFQLIAHMSREGEGWDYEIDKFSETTFIDTVSSLYKRVQKYDGAKILTFESKGKNEIRKYNKKILKMIDEANSDFESEYLSKLMSLFGSLVAVIHELTEKKTECVISIKTIKMVQNIIETAIDNALHMYGTEKRETVQTIMIKQLIEDGLKKHPIPKNGCSLKQATQNMRKVTIKDAYTYFDNKKGYILIPKGRGHRVIPENKK